jgi:hypothetical protein
MINSSVQIIIAAKIEIQVGQSIFENLFIYSIVTLGAVTAMTRGSDATSKGQKLCGL